MPEKAVGKTLHVFSCIRAGKRVLLYFKACVNDCRETAALKAAKTERAEEETLWQKLDLSEWAISAMPY